MLHIDCLITWSLLTAKYVQQAPYREHPHLQHSCTFKLLSACQPPMPLLAAWDSKCRLSFATVGLIAKVDLPSHNDDPILQV